MSVQHSNEEKELIDRLCLKDSPIKRGSTILASRVYSIAGQNIHPDIDILKIETYGGERRAIGYEVKWLKRYKDGGLSWHRFYKGLGQALCYFRLGITQVTLVLGWDDLPKSYSSEMDRFCGFIFENFTAIKPSITSGVLSDRLNLCKCFGFLGYDGSLIPQIIYGADDHFPFYAVKDEALRESLKNLHYNLCYRHFKAKKFYYR